ncbi:ParA family partition ATPase [Pseudomonas sp. UMAB-40]|uniref:ParA family partition ATPase n=1 Tax=Pseudomonas sp. UMAB-40 TaxID=1365407 RepID=UPI00214B9522|nr:ParA family partition ATPase [Pseudomonas sp. UMAB-40]
MTVFAIMNGKGGVGKTTICAGLSRALGLAGKDVALVDSDPQGSMQDLAGENAEQSITIYTIERTQLAAQIPRLTNEIVIIDGTAKAADLAKKTIAVADIIIIPVTPSPLDVWATSDIVGMIQDRMDELSGTGQTLKAYFLVNRAIGNSKLSKSIAKTLAGYGFPVLKSRLVSRTAHPNSQLTGQTPLDTQPNGLAARELRALRDEVLAMLA